MDLKVSHDVLPGAAPIYDSPEGETLTWDWENETWTDAKVGNRNKLCRGMNATGDPRRIIPAVANAVLELTDSRKGGGLLLSWYPDDDEKIVIALIWSKDGLMGAMREKGEGPSQDWPKWWPARSVDRGLLAALHVSLS